MSKARLEAFSDGVMAIISLILMTGIGLFSLSAGAMQNAAVPFTAHTVASGIRAGYQVVATDVNKDGKIDLIALGMQMPELVWFENPSWTRHVITTSAPRLINMDAADTDGDGIPEIGLAYEFSTNPAQSLGKIAVLKHKGDPAELWDLKEIDAVPTAHRVRWADVEGNGKKFLINAPILNAKAPGFADPERLPTPLVAYRPGEWKKEIITEANQGVVHGLFAGDWNGDGRDEVLTAGYLGIFAHSLGRDGKWTRTELAKGNPAPYPTSGASDIALGTINKKRFFVTNEPFHGNQVVVYVEGAQGQFDRIVIDTQLVNSHSLLLVDINADGNHEIVSGGTRGPAQGVKPGVFLYRAADATGQKWDRVVLDDGIAANSCVAADINGDRKIDISCIDNSAPFNLKWYENTR